MKLTKSLLENAGFEFKSGLCPYIEHNGIKIWTYGGEICDIEIDGKDVRNVFPMPELQGADDSIEYCLAKEATEFILARLGIEESEV